MSAKLGWKVSKKVSKVFVWNNSLPCKSWNFGAKMKQFSLTFKMLHFCLIFNKVSFTQKKKMKLKVQFLIQSVTVWNNQVFTNLFSCQIMWIEIGIVISYFLKYFCHLSLRKREWKFHQIIMILQLKVVFLPLFPIEWFFWKIVSIL